MPTSPPNERDVQFMAVALRLAERGLGQVWPNPAVGCVVVKDDHVVGRGWTQPGGRPHAEFEALKRAGAQALGATAYVTLEPCAHYGQTPPCTMALLHAGIRRAVIAAGDPDPRVDGRGIEQLRQAGVEVAVGLAQDEAERLNAGFFLRVRAGRPLITLKLATSLDGRIATRTGASRWITGEEARQRAHHLRATPRRDHGRQRHRARRRPGADLPAAGPGAALARCASSWTAACVFPRAAAWRAPRARCRPGSSRAPRPMRGGARRSSAAASRC